MPRALLALLLLASSAQAATEVAPGVTLVPGSFVPGTQPDGNSVVIDAPKGLIVVESWRLLPFSTVIILAGLTAIPKDIPEAAAVDGAGFFRTLFEITIPMMRPILNVALLFGIIFTFTDMTVVYILTAGGPADATQVLPSYAFFTGIQGFDLAAGAATSLFLVPILAVVAYLMLRMAARAEVV
jgi:multiple sugar transport system permease protein